MDPEKVNVKVFLALFGFVGDWIHAAMLCQRSPIATGFLVGLDAPNKAQSPRKLKRETLKISGVFVNF